MQRIPINGIASPSDIAGLVCDIDLSSAAGLFSDTAGTVPITSDSDVVGYATDHSGNGNHAIADTNDRRPSWDGERCYFSATNKLTIASDASLNLSNPTYVVVGKYEALAGSGFLFNKDATNAATLGIRLHNGRFETLWRTAGSPGTSIQINPPSPFDDGLHVHVVAKRSTELQYWIDNAQASVSVDSDGVDTAAGTLAVGGHPDTSSTGAEANIYRFLVFNRALTLEEIRAVTRWAMSTYRPLYVREGTIDLDVEVDGHSIEVVGSTANIVYGRVGGNQVSWATADISEPHVWTVQNTNIFTAAAQMRGIDARFYAGTWYVFYDDFTSGGLYLRTGPTLDALTAANGGSAILQGNGTPADLLEFVRHPAVLTPSETPDGNWHMLIDGRANSPSSEFGAIGHATAPANDPTNWTLDASPVLSPSGLEDYRKSDLTHPKVRCLSDGTYELIFAGYSATIRSSYIADAGAVSYPHFIASATSPDLLSWTMNKLNPVLVQSAGIDAPERGGVGSPEFYDSGNGDWCYYQGFSPNPVARTLVYARRHAPFPRVRR